MQASDIKALATHVCSLVLTAEDDTAATSVYIGELATSINRRRSTMTIVTNPDYGTRVAQCASEWFVRTWQRRCWLIIYEPEGHRFVAVRRL